jgi:hypothetical protein
MKVILQSIVILFLLLSINIQSQDILFIPRDTLLTGPLGTEFIFYIDLINISPVEQTVFLVRNQNILPPDWQSSLCFVYCFAPDLDSIVTNGDFGSRPLTPGEEREVSLHIFSQTNTGTAYVTVEAGTFLNPNNRIVVNLTAEATTAEINDSENEITGFSLSQNYPNPFNPTTAIRFSVGNIPEIIAGRQLVTLKIYDVLGNEIATLINEEKPAGEYEVKFDGSSLSSGLYFYRLQAGNYSKTMKLTLLK